MAFLLFLVFIVLPIGVIAYMRYKNRYISQSPWQHYYDNFQFSTQDFYSQVVEAIKKRQVPNVEIDRESFLQTHIASERREYLRIRRGESVFYICSAPFGTGSFVSNWFCVRREHFWEYIPLINKLAGTQRSSKSFYQQDAQAMYRSVVHTAVMEVLDGLTEAKGVRGLTELEKQYKD